MKKRIVFNAPVTLGFVFLSLAVLAAGYLTAGRSSQLLFTTYHSSPKDPLTYVRFVTHVLGHLGWEHYIGNMTYLLLLGPQLEEKYGSSRIFLLMVLTAVVTGAVHYFLFPGAALCGASGICFAFILMTSFTGFKEGELPLSFILVAVLFLGQQVYEMVLVRNNVSNLSHIIGGVIGGFAGYRFNVTSDDSDWDI